MLLGECKKNTSELLRVSLAEFKGHEFVDVRVYFETDEGAWRPSQKRVAIPFVCLNEIIEYLQAAQRKVKRKSRQPGTVGAGGKQAQRSSECGILQESGG